MLNMVGGHGNGDKLAHGIGMHAFCVHMGVGYGYMGVWVSEVGSSGILIHMDGCDGLNRLKSKLVYGQMVMVVAIAPPFPIVIAYKLQ